MTTFIRSSSQSMIEKKKQAIANLQSKSDNSKNNDNKQQSNDTTRKQSVVIVRKTTNQNSDNKRTVSVPTPVSVPATGPKLQPNRTTKKNESKRDDLPVTPQKNTVKPVIIVRKSPQSVTKKATDTGNPDIKTVVAQASNVKQNTVLYTGTPENAFVHKTTPVVPNSWYSISFESLQELKGTVKIVTQNKQNLCPPIRFPNINHSRTVNNDSEVLYISEYSFFTGGHSIIDVYGTNLSISKIELKQVDSSNLKLTLSTALNNLVKNGDIITSAYYRDSLQITLENNFNIMLNGFLKLWSEVGDKTVSSLDLYIKMFARLPIKQTTSPSVLKLIKNKTVSDSKFIKTVPVCHVFINQPDDTPNTVANTVTDTVKDSATATTTATDAVTPTDVKTDDTVVDEGETKVDTIHSYKAVTFDEKQIDFNIDAFAYIKEYMRQVLVLALKNKTTVIHSVGCPITGIVGQYISVQLKLKHIYEVNDESFGDNSTDVNELKRRLHKIILNMCNKVLYNEKDNIEISDKYLLLKNDESEKSEQIEQVYVQLSN